MYWLFPGCISAFCIPAFSHYLAFVGVRIPHRTFTLSGSIGYHVFHSGFVLSANGKASVRQYADHYRFLYVAL